MENADTYKPKQKALVIAVSDYLNLPSDSQLPFCKNDGDSMASTLSALGYEVARKHIGTVTGDEFKDSIIDFFRDEGLDPKDTTLFYFSGHGVSDKKGSGKYFGTTDIDPDIPERKGISYDFLIDQMEKSNSLKRIAILDCCYSGAAHPYIASKAVGDPEQETEKMGREDLKVFEKSQGICVLASSLSNKLSYFIEDEKMSTYTHYIIEGLKGKSDSVDKQGFVTPSTLEEYAFTQMLRSDPKMQRPVNNLSTSGKIVLAYHKELRPIPNNPLSENAANAYMLGRYSDVIEYCDKILENNPKDLEAFYNKGLALNSLARYEEAIECYDKALEIDAKNVFALNHKGFALSKLGKYNEAIECYDKAILIDPTYEDPFYNKGYSLRRLERYNEAIEWFDKALEINPRYVQALYNKGRSLGKLGKYKEAIVCYEKALEIDPRNSLVWAAKAELEKNIGLDKP